MILAATVCGFVVLELIGAPKPMAGKSEPAKPDQSRLAQQLQPVVAPGSTLNTAAALPTDPAFTEAAATLPSSPAEHEMSANAGPGADPNASSAPATASRSGASPGSQPQVAVSTPAPPVVNDDRQNRVNPLPPLRPAAPAANTGTVGATEMAQAGTLVDSDPSQPASEAPESPPSAAPHAGSAAHHRRIYRPERVLSFWQLPALRSHRYETWLPNGPGGGIN